MNGDGRGFQCVKSLYYKTLLSFTPFLHSSFSFLIWINLFNVLLSEGFYRQADGILHFSSRSTLIGTRWNSWKFFSLEVRLEVALISPSMVIQQQKNLLKKALPMIIHDRTYEVYRLSYFSTRNISGIIIFL